MPSEGRKLRRFMEMVAFLWGLCQMFWCVRLEREMELFAQGNSTEWAKGLESPSTVLQDSTIAVVFSSTDWQINLICVLKLQKWKTSEINHSPIPASPAGTDDTPEHHSMSKYLGTNLRGKEETKCHGTTSGECLLPNPFVPWQRAWAC